jgi:HK97 family phage portal protein
VVHELSTTVAATGWHLYRSPNTRRNSTTDRVEVFDHPALNVWQTPNPFYSRQEFVESAAQHLDLTGETTWVVGTNDGLGGIPTELWIIRPDRLSPVPSPTDYLTGWVHTAPDGERTPLDRGQVLQLKYPNPSDPYRGLGPVQSLMVDLDAARHSAEWNLRFFLNSAQPGGIIETPDRLSDPEFHAFRARWAEQHQGTDNAHRVALLENAKWVSAGLSQKEMQFIELRNISREIIREAFGMSKTMLGLSEDVNRATAEAAEYVFAKYRVATRLDRFKLILNTELLPMFGTLGQGYEFDFDSPVDGDADREIADRDSRVAAVVALIGAGADPAVAAKVFDVDPVMFSTGTRSTL